MRFHFLWMPRWMILWNWRGIFVFGDEYYSCVCTFGEGAQDSISWNVHLNQFWGKWILVKWVYGFIKVLTLNIFTEIHWRHHFVFKDCLDAPLVVFSLNFHLNLSLWLFPPFIAIERTLNATSALQQQHQQQQQLCRFANVCALFLARPKKSFELVSWQGQRITMHIW